MALRNARPVVLALFGLLAAAPSCGGGNVSGGDRASLLDLPGQPDVVQPDYGTDEGDRDAAPADAQADPGLPDVQPADAGRDLPAAGQFGAPCRSNNDCDSGYCVEGVEGPVCTRTCQFDCPVDWVCRASLIGSDVISLCLPLGADLCKPCQVDTQCGDGLCLSVGGGTFCGRDCSQSPCPGGFDCRDVPVDGGTARQCVPQSGACDCLPEHDGERRPCARRNDAGTCLGFETCVPDLGWDCDAPEPRAEACNGLDDNCNRLVDEDFPEVGEACTAGQGTCRAAGTWRCRADGTAAECDAAPGAAGTESCNGLDDDCDGQTDEGFRTNGAYRTDRACGSCFVDCTAIFTPATHNARGACDDAGPAPVCRYDCEDGWKDANGFRDDGCELAVSPTVVHVSTPENGGSDVAGCGAWDSPCATVSHGIDVARDGGRTEVRVSEGLYAENVVLADGVSVKGGYGAVDWQRAPDTNLTILQGTTPGAAPGAHRKAVVADGITAATEFSGFTVFGENDDRPAAGLAGGNSYALWIRDCGPGLSVKDNVVYAGRGAPGGDGANGDSGDSGNDGAPGGDCRNAGAYACSGVTGTGGSGGASPCGTAGGKGADATCPAGQNQMPAGARGSGAAGGAGGAGGWSDTVEDDCSICRSGGKTDFGYDGARGGHGTDGTAGGACSDDDGQVLDGEWVPANAGAGAAGANGSGGGGGGAGGGVDFLSATCTFYDRLGTSGGGGGAGGCGGDGGSAGRSGGASIAILVARTGSAPTGLPVLSGNVVVRNRGGDGGQGGAGGTGGVGGSGGEAGAVTCADNSEGSAYWFKPCVGQGGTGGDGGRGGAGGGGGGGCGGASYGILGAGVSGLSPSWCGGAGNAFERAGDGGNGGAGGNSAGRPGVPGTAGDAGDCVLR